MRIYLFNRSGSSNLGDQLIGRVIRIALEQAGGKVVLNKVYPGPNNRIHAFWTHVRSYLADIKQIAVNDRLLIGGGNLIMDSAGKGWAVHHYWLSLLCRLLNKRYDYIFVGVNPLRKKISRLLYRVALRHATKISARDSLSQRYISMLSVRDDVNLVFDPVLSIAEYFPFPLKNDDENTAVIGICPVNIRHPSIGASPQVCSRYVELHSRMISELINRGKQVELFLNDLLVDRKIVEEISQQLPSPLEGLRIVENFESLESYLAYIAGLDVLIGSRMHAIICGLSYGVPSLGLGWQPKMEYLFRDLGLTGYLDILNRLETDNSVDTILDEIITFCIEARHDRSAYAKRLTKMQLNINLE
jgi:polysaccharide pyruvyl transferase WcaK-like protein